MQAGSSAALIPVSMCLRVTLTVTVLCIACNRTAPPAAETRPAPPLSAVSGTIPAADESGDWVRPGRDYASTRFSPLADMTPETVRQLGVRITFATGVLRGHEAAPLVVGNTMYIVTPYPNLVHALDLTQPGAPAKWTYNPKPLRAAQGVACCDVVNRGLSYADGMLFFNTLDNRTIALDAATGRERWATLLGDINKGETMTMAPLVVKGRVLVGNSGGELGVRGWLTALDAASGSIVWRAYSTGPDRDVLIGPRFMPFYDHLEGQDLGVHSWPGEAWKQGAARPGGESRTMPISI